MVKQQLEQDLKKAVESLGFEAGDVVCDISKNSQFGDYTTNIALQLAKSEAEKRNQSSGDIAKQILEKLGSLDYIEKSEVAGPGFINFFLKNKTILEVSKTGDKIIPVESPKNILVEYGHVNPLKEIHIGHLRTFILGESICRILESTGNKVFRANYQGDIGLHIGKAIWGIKKLGLPTKELSLEEKAEFLGKAYALGATNYDVDDQVKAEINKITKSLYIKDDPEVEKVYKLARDWSLEYFNPIYERLGVKYDRCFFESEVFEEGLKIVKENIGKVFEENDGAVIFPGEKYGLHTRVFVTSAGNPTYEGKEVGLAKQEYEAFDYDLSIHVVASEQAGYFEVVIKAIELIFPYLKDKKHHLSYGLVDLKQGKMSSRTGDVVTVDDLVSVVSEKVREVVKGEVDKIDQNLVKQIALGAIKFSYLKYSPEPNMVFDLEKSVSLQGDSGPYVQYTYARINSLLQKGSAAEISTDESLNSHERELLRYIMYFNDVVAYSAKTYHPNLISEYLVTLSKLFNLFYQECKIIGSEQEGLRLYISAKVASILKQGLNMLGIDAPLRM